MVIQQMSSNFQAKLTKRISSRNYVPHEKLYSAELNQLKKVILSFLERGVKSYRMSFLGGLMSEWMKSGHGGREGKKRSKMGGRPLYTVPYVIRAPSE